ncbi:histidine triad nucleotide-binding protein [Bdellovibrionota bacterium FG-1]
MTDASKEACIFCKIISGQIPAPRIFEDESFICIRDIHPQAKIHLLVLPKQHIESLDAAFPQSGAAQTDLVGRLFEVGTHIARANRLLPGGFRSVINTGVHGGQTIFHLHLHLLSE